MGEMVLDGGDHFIPAGIFGLHILSLLLASRVAHDRATEDDHTRAGKERHNIIVDTWVQYTALDKKVLTPSPYE